MAHVATKTQTIIACLLLLATILAACAPSASTTTPDATPSATQPALEGTQWQLTSLNGEALLEGTHITLAFEGDALSGFAGCNAYGGGPDGGGYAAAPDGSLTIPPIAITLMACTSPAGVMAQEEAYVEALQQAATYRVVDDRLELQNAAGETTLVFNQQERADADPGDLLGTAWRLVSMDGTLPAQDVSITLVFHDAHRISGSAGCRDYVSVYAAEGDDLNLSFTGMLGPECADDALLEQEGTYTTILGWTSHYRLSEGQLELLTLRGETLVFEPLAAETTPALEGPTWSLLAFVEPNPVEGMPAPLPLATDVRSGTEITITFSDGVLRGSAGCNSYQAAYTRDASVLTIGSTAVTEMFCLSPEGVMEQEDQYLRVLEDVVGFHIHGGQLWLETGDGRALVFSVPAR